MIVFAFFNLEATFFRSASRLGNNTMSNIPSKVQPDSLVKDYTKKRWLILALLSVEIETLVTHQVIKTIFFHVKICL